MALAPGTVVDSKYRIERSIGRGGMAVVYAATNTDLHRRVAMKVLNQKTATADGVERFHREAQAAGRIGSPHIVEVLDLGHLPDGSPYMVMEYLDGETLSARQKRLGQVRVEEAVPLIRQVLDGLEAAHTAGVIHRDLKPANVFIMRAEHGEFVKLIDFGVSKFQMMKAVTRTSVMLGTPTYMAPEQTKGGKTVDARTDVFSAGATLYKVVAGRSPYDAEGFNAVVIAIGAGAVVPLEDVVDGVDPGFASIVARAMAFDPEHRYQSAAEFSRALGAWEDGRMGAGGNIDKTVTDVRPMELLEEHKSAARERQDTPAPRTTSGFKTMLQPIDPAVAALPVISDDPYAPRPTPAPQAAAAPARSPVSSNPAPQSADVVSSGPRRRATPPPDLEETAPIEMRRVVSRPPAEDASHRAPQPSSHPPRQPEPGSGQSYPPQAYQDSVPPGSDERRAASPSGQPIAVTAPRQPQPMRASNAALIGILSGLLTVLVLGGVAFLYFAYFDKPSSGTGVPVRPAGTP